MALVPVHAIAPELTCRDLATIRRLVYERAGIALHAGKGALVSARLQKRLRAGGFRSFREYIRFVQADPSGDELTALLDAIATNHTAFFREPQHFEFLRDTVLPPLVARVERGGFVNAWSAACATGEEAYTIAMLLFERLGAESTTRVRLLASDLSTKALAVACAAVYKAQRLRDVPRDLARKYFVKETAGTVRVVDAVRRAIEFRQLNLLDAGRPTRMFDFIFCRNVMIYFDRPVQQRVVASLERRLVPGGYLFVSHSESLNSIQHAMTWIAPAVYRREAR